MAMFDLAKTEEVERLFAVAADQRDSAWRQRFYAAVGDASMAADHPQVANGPDGFPYFNLHLPPLGQAFETFCVNHVLEPCTENGFGCVIHDRAGDTGWVFTYGNLWSQRIYATFDDTPDGDPAVAEVLSKDEQVLVGSPSEGMLPSWARAVLRTYLQSIGIESPKVAAVMRGQGHPSRSLALTLPADEASAHRVTWFLPPQLGLLGAAAVGEENLQPL
jgi:hypothetical protein